MSAETRYSITMADILRAQRLHDEQVFYRGLMESDIVLDLILTKFDFKESTHFYKLIDGECIKHMGYYVDKGEWVTIYEVKENNFWVRRLKKEEFLTLYGDYIAKVQPENPEEVEIDENDALTRAVEISKIVKSINQHVQTSQN